MRIESLKTEPDRAGRYWLTFEDGTKLALYRQTVEDFALFSGKELTEDLYSAQLEAAGAMSAKMRAVRIVAASSVSKKDLKHRLIQKGEAPSDAADAVAWMEEMHLLDDGQTARQVVSRCAAHGYCIQRAKQALYEKKIPKEYWEEALADYPDQTASIVSFLRARLTDLSDRREVKRATDALLRRGHSYSDVRRAFHHLDLDMDDLPEE
jgi:regulatory protein